jgi:hypothetical protein
MVEVAEEVVGEDLLGGAKLAAGSAGWGNNQSGLPPMRRSQRKMTVGKSCGPALLSGTVGRLLVQEGRGDEALLLARSDSSGHPIGDGQRRVKQRPTQIRAARSVVERGRGKSGVGDSFLSDIQSSAKEGPTHVGGDDRRSPAPSALRPVSVATENRGGMQDRATVPSGQMETGR